MAHLWEKILRCPVCGGAVSRENGVLACHGVRRHCFDLASAGYVNLAPAKAAGGGDDAAHAQLSLVRGIMPLLPVPCAAYLPHILRVEWCLMRDAVRDITLWK